MGIRYLPTLCLVGLGAVPSLVFCDLFRSFLIRICRRRISLRKSIEIRSGSPGRGKNAARYAWGGSGCGVFFIQTEVVALTKISIRLMHT